MVASFYADVGVWALYAVADILGPQLVGAFAAADV